MPAKHSLHVVLTEQLVRCVRDKVATAQHATISDVLRASLRTTVDLEQAVSQAESVRTSEIRHDR